MPIALVGTPQGNNAINGANVTLTFDVAPSEGDVVVVFGGHGVVENAGPAAPGTGYTQLAKHTGSRPIWGAWYKVMGASPDSDVICSGGGDPADGVAYCSYVFSGVDAAVLDQVTVTVGPSLSPNPNCPSITTQTDGAWVLALAGGSTHDASPGTVSGYSNQVNQPGNDTQDITTAGATFEKVTAGAEDPPAWDTWANTWWYAATVALKPAAAVSASKLLLMHPPALNGGFASGGLSR